MTQEEKAKYLALMGAYETVKERYQLLAQKVVEQRVEIQRLREQLGAQDAAFEEGRKGMFATIHENHQCNGVRMAVFTFER